MFGYGGFGNRVAPNPNYTPPVHPFQRFMSRWGYGGNPVPPVNQALPTGFLMPNIGGFGTGMNWFNPAPPVAQPPAAQPPATPPVPDTPPATPPSGGGGMLDLNSLQAMRDMLAGENRGMNPFVFRDLIAPMMPSRDSYTPREGPRPSYNYSNLGTPPQQHTPQYRGVAGHTFALPTGVSGKLVGLPGPTSVPPLTVIR